MPGVPRARPGRPVRGLGDGLTGVWLGMTSVNDIWAATYGSTFSNIVETVFNCQGEPVAERQTRGAIAEKIRIEAAKEARLVATEAVRALMEVQEAEMTDEERADWDALDAGIEGDKKG